MVYTKHTYLQECQSLSPCVSLSLCTYTYYMCMHAFTLVPYFMASTEHSPDICLCSLVPKAAGRRREVTGGSLQCERTVYKEADVSIRNDRDKGQSPLRES